MRSNQYFVLTEEYQYFNIFEDMDHKQIKGLSDHVTRDKSVEQEVPDWMKTPPGRMN